MLLGEPTAHGPRPAAHNPRNAAGYAPRNTPAHAPNEGQTWGALALKPTAKGPSKQWYGSEDLAIIRGAGWWLAWGIAARIPRAVSREPTCRGPWAVGSPMGTPMSKVNSYRWSWAAKSMPMAQGP